MSLEELRALVVMVFFGLVGAAFLVTITGDERRRNLLARRSVWRCGHCHKRNRIPEV